MRFRKALLAVLLLLLLVPSAPAQEAGAAAARIEAAMQRARAAELPLSLLESKVAEGRAKGASGELIATAVEQRLGSALRAREIMRRVPNLTPADLSVGADALEAGVGEPMLEALIREAPADRRTVAIGVLTQLVHLGERPGPALQRVRDALQRGPAALQRLPAEVAAEKRRGALPGAGPPANAGQGRGAAHGRSPGGPPAAASLRGNRPGPDKKPANPKPPKKQP